MVFSRVHSAVDDEARENNLRADGDIRWQWRVQAFRIIDRQHRHIAGRDQGRVNCRAGRASAAGIFNAEDDGGPGGDHIIDVLRNGPGSAAAFGCFDTVRVERHRADGFIRQNRCCAFCRAQARPVAALRTKDGGNAKVLRHNAVIIKQGWRQAIGEL